MYGATTYEIVLPCECFALSDPVPGTGEWRDRVSVNVWLLSIADVTTVKATVSDCYQKLLIWIMSLPRDKNDEAWFKQGKQKTIFV
jgi:hypothetical protein